MCNNIIAKQYYNYYGRHTLRGKGESNGTDGDGGAGRRGGKAAAAAAAGTSMWARRSQVENEYCNHTQILYVTSFCIYTAVENEG